MFGYPSPGLWCVLLMHGRVCGDLQTSLSKAQKTKNVIYNLEIIVLFTVGLAELATLSVGPILQLKETYRKPPRSGPVVTTFYILFFSSLKEMFMSFSKSDNVLFKKIVAIG